MTKVKNKVKKVIEEGEAKQSDIKIKSLVQQGHLLGLAIKENSDFEWRSYWFILTKGKMKFLLNVSIDTLPTKTNLMRWGKSPTNKCKHCGVQETTSHILNSCTVYLNQC